MAPNWEGRSISAHRATRRSAPRGVGHAVFFVKGALEVFSISLGETHPALPTPRG